MIHTFNKKRKQLFFPTNWANSVSAWCLGVSSPRGTLEIGNTATPVEGSPSLKLDINEARLESLFDKHLAKRLGLSTAERKAVQNIIGASVDQKFLKWSDYIIQLDTETLVKEMPFAKVPQTQDEAGASIPENDGTTPVGSETAEQKKGRVGDSEYAAHADHQHPLNVLDSDALVAQIVKNGEDIPFGTSSYYARADHTHDLPELTGDDIFYDGEVTVGAELDELLETTLDHEDRIAALESATPPTPTAPVTSVNGKTGAVVLTGADINWKSGWTVTAGLNDYNTRVYTPLNGKSTDLLLLTNGSGAMKAMTYTADNNNVRYFRLAKGSGGAVTVGTIPAADITDANCSSGGDCLAYFDSNKHLAHLGNTGMTKSKLNALDAVVKWGGASPSFTYTGLGFKAFGATAAPTTKKVVGFNASGETATLLTLEAASLQPNAVDAEDPEWDTQAKVAAAAPKKVEAILQSYGGASETAAHKIARIGTSKYAAREDHSHPFEHVTGANDNLKKGTTAGDAIPSGATYARDTQSWTRDSTGTLNSSGGQTSAAYNGVNFLVVSRIERMAGTGLDVLYLRTATFDKNGCLYNVSEESTKCFIHFNNT